MAVIPFNYAESIEDAQELLEEFGTVTRIKRKVPGNGPAYQPGPGSWVTYEAFAVRLRASKGTIEAFDNRIEGGTLIEENLRYVIMSPVLTRVSEDGPVTIEPKSGDVLEFDGDEWVVLGCTPLKPAGEAILYPMGCRRLGPSGA